MCAAFRVIRKNGFCFNKKPENYALTWFVHLEEWIRRVVANFIQIYMDFVDLAQISRVIFNKLRLFAQFAWTMIADHFFVSSDCVVENVASGTINLQHCLSHINENRQYRGSLTTNLNDEGLMVKNSSNDSCAWGLGQTAPLVATYLGPGFTMYALAQMETSPIISKKAKPFIVVDS